MTNEVIQIGYSVDGKTIKAFHESNAFVRGIMGPIGSGKSTACVIEILRRAQMQKPSPDGIRRTRWAILRNSYPELKSTTLKTWGEWCPIEYGKLNQDSPITHTISTSDLHIEVLFLALDREEDIRKLLSLELTGGFLNETRFMPKAIVDALTGRVGRYPSKSQGGATWSGIIMDTNPPDDQSWWYRLAEEETPKGWEFFKQPAGDSPEAENLKNLPTNYYERIKEGKDEDWVKVFIQGQYGFVTEGKAVFSMFRDRTHTAPEALEPVVGYPLLVGVDFGLTPAAVIGQKLVDGRWLILDEFITENCGIVRFAENLVSYVNSHYPDSKVDSCWGDPSGTTRSQTDERTALEIMKEYTGWDCRSAPSNELLMRREVVVNALNRMVDGSPGFLISPNAKVLRKGFAGGYHYKTIQSANGSQSLEQPAKNQYSHPHDALGYLLLGGGEHDVVMNRVKSRSRVRSKQAKDVDYDIFGED